ncbi:MULTISPECIES: class I SAM-dependent methyltransferase [unclassified Streptomyces]|uniref:class I SAM-dependent methyltransferase n=1 Tax=unclassified Streptomyces TaxID=2593676 RepID=UPI000DAB9AC5|nr:MULTISPECIES: class I SAM-dependent methyltransferase [unclassified Streptomyces]PZT76907.1 class I SAM-dependent methyltransferase [Streptomyces sp. AC1-42W]PZT79137.1 class I SAM-dependent methyltransferase [Streptomyces sp. AC1-42T]
MTDAPVFPPEPGSTADVVRTWDARAEHYLRLFRDELDGKPYDLEVLRAFAERVGAGGRVYDAGCGPCGHVTALLASYGLDVLGIDLSPRCVELARRERPGHRFAVMDQGALTGGPLDGLVAYYSLHDRPKRVLPATLAGWASAIRPGGQLLIVAKEGTADHVIDDPLGSELRVYWAEFTANELGAAVRDAGFRLDGCTVREAYEGEIPARRVYLAAVRC